MENVHNAIAWYQKKIGSYDKQLWEQSVEKKLQKQPPFVLHNAPRKKVRLKTEYIDVDLIRGSTFAKAKPQVPWVYITRKAVARVLFFPFYYNWWVHQTSKQLYAVLFVLYTLQVVTIVVYLRNFDHSIMEDVGIAEELSFTEVILPTILMFLLCLIHSQTVLAHINHKPPKRAKTISGVTRKARPKKIPRKGRTSGNNSTCAEDGGNTDTSKSSKVHFPSSTGGSDSKHRPSETQKSEPPVVASHLDMEKNLLSRSVSDYDLKPVTSSTNHQSAHHHHHHRHHTSTQRETAPKSAKPQAEPELGADKVLEKTRPVRPEVGGEQAARSDWGHRGNWGTRSVQKSGCCYNLLDNLPNLLTVEKVCRDVGVASDNDDTEDGDNDVGIKFKKQDSYRCPHGRDATSADREGLDYFLCGDITDSRPKVGADGGVKIVGQALSACADNYADCDCLLASKQSSHHVSSCQQTQTGQFDSRDVRSCSETDLNPCHRHCHQQEPSSNRDILPSPFHGPMLNDPSYLACKSDKFACQLSNRPMERQDGVLDWCSSTHKDLCHCSNTQPDKNHHHVLFSKGLPKKPISNSTSGVADVSEFSQEHSTEKCPKCPDVHRQIRSLASAVSDTNLDLQVATSSRLCLTRSGGAIDQLHPAHHNDLRCSDKLFKNHVKFSNDQGVCGHHEPSSSRSLPYLRQQVPSSGCQKGSRLEQVPGYGSQKESKLEQLPSCGCQKGSEQAPKETDSQLQCFSDVIVQEILNEETLRSCSSLLIHSDLENSSSSISHLSSSSVSSLSSSYRLSNIDHIPPSTPSGLTLSSLPSCKASGQLHTQSDTSEPPGSGSGVTLQQKGQVTAGLDALDESLEQINMSDGERPSDISNYNPSDSDGESDGPANEDLRNKFEEKWKRLRFQELEIKSDEDPTKCNGGATTGPKASTSSNKPSKTGSGSGPRSVVGILTRKPSPLKDLAIGRMASANGTTNSSGSDVELNESRSQLRRRRRTSGTTGDSGETTRSRNVPNTLGIRSHNLNGKHISSSENEAGAHTPEGSNKATMSSEEWEDHMQSDETTSSAYSSSCGNSDDSGEEGEEKTEYTTSTLHVINLLQPGLQPGCLPPTKQTANGLLPPGIMTNQTFTTYRKPQQSGSPTSSGTITQPDKVSCVIWEGSECRKVDLTALDIGWAIIDKVDSLPESSDYFLIGLLFSVVMGVVPLVFRIYVNKEMARWEDFMTLPGIWAQLSEVPNLLGSTYSWRQYLLMFNGIVQRFFLSLIFFFLLSVADRTFKQRLLYAKHFSYLTSSRRARKFSMPHFRLNKVRNIKIWLSLRSYLKRRGPQRSVDVIVSACFLCAICTVCLISLQMLKDTESYLDYLCNWELMVWCISLGVFLMRFMTVGLKINKKYRNLSVLITEQINLYLQMEQKPHKKEELILANNVLRLAEDLLKELESPFKISGFSANPLIYNIMRVVVLSAFSAVLTEVLGFKLKLHKIKLKG
ncbi:unnamed protein product [Lymnaea stagnalis]|uniref:PHTF1/2 N-terminal domain-containing protein n=1 Tax=Lymnaea stagnalis TaxID=6523 RepID=A0AAV2I6X5_LYMST